MVTNGSSKETTNQAKPNLKNQIKHGPSQLMLDYKNINLYI